MNFPILISKIKINYKIKQKKLLLKIHILLSYFVCVIPLHWKVSLQRNLLVKISKQL